MWCVNDDQEIFPCFCWGLVCDNILQVNLHSYTFILSAEKSILVMLNFFNYSNVTTELADIDWDNLGFGFMSTDYMYVMKCSQGENFTKGELQRFGNIELSPSAGILNYGQVIL